MAALVAGGRLFQALAAATVNARSPMVERRVDGTCSSSSSSSRSIVVWLLLSGARTDIENNESKTAFDLAKDAETAALLQHAGQSSVL